MNTAVASPRKSGPHLVAPAALPRNRRRPSHELDVVSQVRAAFARGPVAAVLGTLLGAAVPVGVYRLVHCELAALETWRDPRALKAIFVVGGLLFSASKVFAWGRQAFRSPLLALGFVVLAEGAMTFSSEACLSIGALVYLTAINAIATACTLALADGRSR